MTASGVWETLSWVLIFLLIGWFIGSVAHEADPEPTSLYFDRADSVTPLTTPSGTREIVWFDTIPTLCWDSPEGPGWVEVRPVKVMVFNVPDPLFLDDPGCNNR